MVRIRIDRMVRAGEHPAVAGAALHSHIYSGFHRDRFRYAGIQGNPPVLLRYGDSRSDARSNFRVHHFEVQQQYQRYDRSVQ